MRKMLVWSCVVILGLFMCLTGSALAVPVDFNPSGNETEPGAQATFTLVSGMGFYWTSPDPTLWPQGTTPKYPNITFNNFVTYISAGNETFSGTGIINHNGLFGDWVCTGTSATTSTASGSSINTQNQSLGWNYSLALDSGQLKYPLTFDINYFYYDASQGTNTFLGHEHYTITGYKQYDTATGKYDTTQYFPTPLPPSVLLLGSGLLSLGLLGWRRQDS